MSRPLDPQRVQAYEDALRGIAAAAVAARARVRGIRLPEDAGATLLADVEHHLSSLIVLGYVPNGAGRPVTTSAPLPGDRRALD